MFLEVHYQNIHKVYLPNEHNTWIYNLIYVPRTTSFSLEDAILSSKTNPCSGSTKLKRSNGYVRNNETMSAIDLFIYFYPLTKATSKPIFYGAFSV